jgi:transcriptional regulator with XRE-family HTH domain
MSARTNLQATIEQRREVYDHLKKPLLAQLCECHNLTVREVAAIFGISKSYAAELLNHEKLPGLEVAVRFARYFECSVEELFAWRIDDTGERRPLIIELPGKKKLIRLKANIREHSAMGLLMAYQEGEDNLDDSQRRD